MPDPTFLLVNKARRYSGTPLIQKLGITPGEAVWLHPGLYLHWLN
jgi:hypothetical protein